MVYRPLSLVSVCREISVSSDVATISAPSMGWPVGSVTVPVRMSVVVPTCAADRFGLPMKLMAKSATASNAVRHRKFVHPGWEIVTMGRESGSRGEYGLEDPCVSCITGVVPGVLGTRPGRDRDVPPQRNDNLVEFC